MTQTVRLECSDEKSDKFGGGSAEENTLITRWGKIGGKGQVKEKEFASQEKSAAFKKYISEMMYLQVVKACRAPIDVHL